MEGLLVSRSVLGSSLVMEKEIAATEGLLASRSVIGSGKRSRFPCSCQASWSPIRHESQNTGVSPFFIFGNSSNTVNLSKASVDPAGGTCHSSANLHGLAGHEEVTALVHVQKEGDEGCTGQFRTLSEDMAMGLVLQAASGTGWTTGSGLEGPSNLFGLNGGQSIDQTTEQPWLMHSKSPRRRMRVAFTCNVCGERTTRAINPHAYTDGTVFVQCAGCNIFHKLVDNLKLFHELKGSVFPNSVMYGGHGFDEHQPYDFLGLDDLPSV